MGFYFLELPLPGRNLQGSVVSHASIGFSNFFNLECLHFRGVNLRDQGYGIGSKEKKVTRERNQGKQHLLNTRYISSMWPVAFTCTKKFNLHYLSRDWHYCFHQTKEETATQRERGLSRFSELVRGRAEQFLGLLIPALFSTLQRLWEREKRECAMGFHIQSPCVPFEVQKLVVRWA